MVPHDIPIPFPIEFVTIPATNFKKGRTRNPDAIVIHIAEGMKASVVATFKDPIVQKSSHFLVNRDGSITQFVGTADTAYGNGIVDNPISELVLARVGTNPNDWTISIEHEGFSTADITPAQYATTEKLVKFLSSKWDIPLDSTHVFRHREIYAGKTCPGMINVETIIQQARKLT